MNKLFFIRNNKQQILKDISEIIDTYERYEELFSKLAFPKIEQIIYEGVCYKIGDKVTIFSYDHLEAIIESFDCSNLKNVRVNVNGIIDNFSISMIEKRN